MKEQINQHIASIIDHELSNKEVFRESEDTLLFLMDLSVEEESCNFWNIQRKFMAAIYRQADSVLNKSNIYPENQVHTTESFYNQMDGDIETMWKSLDHEFEKETRFTGVRLLAADIDSSKLVRDVDVDAPYSDIYIGILTWREQNARMNVAYVERLETLALNALNGRFTHSRA